MKTEIVAEKNTYPSILQNFYSDKSRMPDSESATRNQLILSFEQSIFSGVYNCKIDKIEKWPV